MASVHHTSAFHHASKLLLMSLEQCQSQDIHIKQEHPGNSISQLKGHQKNKSSMLKLFKSAKNFVTNGLEHRRGYPTRKQYINRLILYNPFPVREFQQTSQWITLHLERKAITRAQSRDGNNLLKTACPTNLQENQVSKMKCSKLVSKLFIFRI